MAALGALAGFTAWLLKDYLAYVKQQAESWRDTARKGANTAEKAADLATRKDE
jgi:hypothetical protein